MSTNFEDVGSFHARFNFPVRDSSITPHELTEEQYKFRIEAMKEELQEYEDAVAAGDLAGQADALIDLVYFAMGTAHYQSFPWHALWPEVHSANMRKIPGMTKRGNAEMDMMKPEGWKAPRINVILESYGYNAPPMGC